MTDSNPVEHSTDVFCPHCGYNVRGLASSICPECGQQFDRAALAQVKLPWTNRRRIGRFRAYWQTVRMACSRPWQLPDEINAPLLLADAKKFWVITCVLGWTPFLIGAAMLADEVRQSFTNVTPAPQSTIRAIVSAWPIAFFAAGALLWLLAASGIAGYFCSPKHISIERQNKAIALCYYACAPLAWAAPAAIGLWLASYLLHRFGVISYPVVLPLIFGSLLVALFILLGWYLRTLRVIRQAAKRSGRAIALLAVALPISWAALFALIAIVLPLMLIYIALFIISRAG
jgi:hypothetical protein